MRATRDNLFTDGARGSTRNMTISKRQSGEFVISARRGPNTKGLSSDQQKVKDRFTRAIAYARLAMKNAEKKAIYATRVRPNFTAYTLAVTDMLNAPRVTLIDMSEYSGQIGQKLTIAATDDFKVVSVKVWIHNAAGELLESGDAALHENDMDWIYTTSVINEQLSGTKITATAFDLPNNQGSLEVTL